MPPVAPHKGARGDYSAANVATTLPTIRASALSSLTSNGTMSAMPRRVTGSKLATASAEKTLFYQVAFTTLVAPLLSLALGERWSLDYSSYAWTSIGLQAAVGAFASYLAWMWMLGRYPATKISVFAFLTPVFALLFGALWLGEAVTTTLLGGSAAIDVNAMFLVVKSSRSRSATASVST